MPDTPLHGGNDEGTIIGIDLGGRRVGLAVSDSGVMATPHSVIRNEGDLVARIDHLGRELEAAAFVVGIPRRMHATPGEQKYRDFAEALRQKSCKPVILWDESLSTVAAAGQLAAAGKSRRDSQREIDMYAAAVILQSYLDEKDHPARRTS